MKISKKTTAVILIIIAALAATACTIESEYVTALKEKIENDLNPPDTSVKFQLTIIAGSGGKILSPNISPLEVKKDDPTSIEAQADSGYLFGYWAITSGEAVIDDYLKANTSVILSIGDATIQAIFTDINAPEPPVVSGENKTNDTTPTWTWISSDEDGIGVFRYKLDDSIMTTGATETTETAFTPSSFLVEGNHTLFVQEKDGFDNWSNIGSHTIEIDITPPESPVFHVSNYSKTSSQQPSWTWTNGNGDGIRIYRFKLDNSDLSDIPEIDETTATSYTPVENLPEGDHTLYVQEKDSVDNWSESASHSIEVDITGPSAPTVTSASSSWDMTPSWSWTSTALDGSGTYRYRLDNSNLEDQVGEASTSYTSSALGNGTHRLYVQEKDDVGNWGTIGDYAVSVSWSPPSLVTPANAGDSYCVEVDLDWNNVTNASGYYIQVDNDPDFNSPYNWTTT